MEALRKCSFMKRFMSPNKIPLAPVHRNTIASCESKCRLHYNDLYDSMLKRVIDPSMKHVYLPANLQGKQTAFRTNLLPMFALVKREKILGAQSFHPRTYFTLRPFRKGFAAMQHNTRVFAAGRAPEVKCMETFIYTPIKVSWFTFEVGVKHVNVGRNHKRMFCYSVYTSWHGRMEVNVKEYPLHPYEKGSFCCLCNKEVKAP